jgi:hypothetical protein
VRFISLSVALLFASLTSFSPAHANDGYGSIAAGGLVLKQSEQISMDREDLYIARDKIRISYTFTNTSDKDIETLVVFPLPDLNLRDEFESARGGVNLSKDLKFETRIDGKPAQLDFVEMAFHEGKDVSQILRNYKIPLDGFGEAFDIAINTLDPIKQKQLEVLGLVENITASGSSEPEVTDYSGGRKFSTFLPTWTLKYFVTRKQVFAAGKSVNVEHQYVPVQGGSVAYELKPDANVKPEDGGSSQLTYCMDRAFYTAYKKRVKQKKTAERDLNYSMSWVSYVLKSGATWKGPIKDFRMVVDKGNEDTLVSFCAEGVKKISPTQFEVVKKDFEPKKDIDVLFLDFTAPKE